MKAKMVQWLREEGVHRNDRGKLPYWANVFESRDRRASGHHAALVVENAGYVSPEMCSPEELIRGVT